MLRESSLMHILHHGERSHAHVFLYLAAHITTCSKPAGWRVEHPQAHVPVTLLAVPSFLATLAELL